MDNIKEKISDILKVLISLIITLSWFIKKINFESAIAITIVGFIIFFLIEEFLED